MTEVSVVVPVFNAGPYLKWAVDSLLAQGLAGLEIVVVDDGSTDGGIAAVERLPVRVVRQKNKGEAAARNAGVRASTAPFVTFLDADDIMVPGGLSARLDFLIAHPGESSAGGLPSRLIDERGMAAGEVFGRMSAKYSFPFRLSGSFYREGGFFPVSCSLYLYRREVFERVGLYDEALTAAPDCDFHFRLLKAASIPILPVPVFDRRIHGANLSLAGAGTRALSFRPEIIDAVREINRRHGYDPEEITPWELEYL
ncbi:MAG: glycosyltransferase family A protein [Elusimicrobia bacterium]|nr:glycosyltransferase family A protein [Elusimicrobiota bacterium]